MSDAELLVLIEQLNIIITEKDDIIKKQQKIIAELLASSQIKIDFTEN